VQLRFLSFAPRSSPIPSYARSHGFKEVLYDDADRHARSAPQGPPPPIALGLAALGSGAVYVLSTQPRPVAVSDGSGVAQFNFRVTGIPVPGVVPGVKVQASWIPRALATATATVKVNLAALDTGIALRDTHAKEFLGVHAHPQATFTLKSLGGLNSLKAGQSAAIVARGVLNLNGVDHTVSAPTSLALDAAGRQLNVTTHFDVAFADYNISIPGADPKTDVTVKFRLPTSQ
jgi:polyisoprenoid-binding protein YceI